MSEHDDPKGKVERKKEPMSLSTSQKMLRETCAMGAGIAAGIVGGCVGAGASAATAPTTNVVAAPAAVVGAGTARTRAAGWKAAYFSERVETRVVRTLPHPRSLVNCRALRHVK